MVTNFTIAPSAISLLFTLPAAWVVVQYVSEIDDRIEEWARMASPQAWQVRVAALLDEDALAEAVRESAASTMEGIQRADRNQPLPLSLAQQRLWFLDQLDKAASAAYHMPAALRLLGRLDVAALQATLDRLVARHEVLRTSFDTIDGVPSGMQGTFGLTPGA